MGHIKNVDTAKTSVKNLKIIFRIKKFLKLFSLFLPLILSYSKRIEDIEDTSYFIFYIFCEVKVAGQNHDVRCPRYPLPWTCSSPRPASFQYSQYLKILPIFKFCVKISYSSRLEPFFHHKPYKNPKIFFSWENVSYSG